MDSFMKIHTNPNFPLLAPTSESPASEQSGTLRLIEALEARNTLALARLREGIRPNGSGKKRHVHPISSTQTQRFSGVTGPPIDAPGGHVHLIEGDIEIVDG